MRIKNKEKVRKFSWFGFVAGMCILIVMGVITVSCWYNFKSNCEDYLKLAGDAPSVEKADMFLGRALGYIEKKNLTSGNSAFVFNTPSNDVGIWYEQIRGAKETTAKLLERKKKDPNSVSEMEASNTLMKIREVVLDASDGKTTVTLPASMDWFPYRWIMTIMWWSAALLTVAGGAGILFIFP